MRTRAFTLVEMIVAMGLLTLLAAFSIPTYQLILAQFQLNSATSEVADFIRLAEQKTVTEQQVYGVTLTSGATTVVLFRYNTATSTKTTQTTLTLPTNIIVSEVNFSGTTDIRFTTAGAPNVSGNVVLRDTLRGRNQRVEVRPSGAILNNTAEF